MWACAVMRYDSLAELHSPYSADFVRLLKARIPKGFRMWEKDEKVWVVEEPYVDQAIEICHMFGSATVIDERMPKTPAKASGDWATALFRGIPERLHKNVYRSLAKALHPDQGGDAEAMKALVRAYEDRGKGK